MTATSHPRILVTGAAGKTGQAVLRALDDRPGSVRALVHRPSHDAVARAAGADDVVRGDLGTTDVWGPALDGIDTVYFIAPNMHPDEVGMARRLVAALRRRSGDRARPHVVYHSVLHPQTEAMPHHWRKLRVEELLVESGLAVTVLQPAPYVQNLAAGWRAIRERGEHVVPYRPETRTALVDLDDVATVAARVSTERGHVGAVYPLCGPDDLDQHQIAAALAREMGRPVQARALDRAAWAQTARRRGLDEGRIADLRAMFRFYERNGLPGNANVLRWLLGREPTSLRGWIRRRLDHSVQA